MSQNNDHDLLEYARYYGLAYDHQQNDPLADIRPLEKNEFLEQLQDPPDVFSIDQIYEFPPPERPSVSKSALSLLQEAIVTSSESISFDDDKRELNHHRVRNFKLELPMLRTDHELDIIEFTPQVVPDLEHEFLPLEIMDEEADEGLSWPTKYSTLFDEYARKFESETLTVSNDALIYLRDALKVPLGREVDALEAEFLPFERSKIRHLITPPTPPLSLPIQPLVPSSDAGHLDLLSDSTSPTHDEVLQAEQVNFRKDKMVLGKRSRDSDQHGLDTTPMDLADIEQRCSPLQEIKDLPSSPLPKRMLSQDREVGGSLIPLATKRSPLWEEGNALVGDFSNEMMKFSPLVPTSGDVVLEGIDTFFTGNSAPIPTITQRRVEQEQLQEAETTGRVPVLITPPWKSPKHRTKPGFLDKDHDSLLCEMDETRLSVHAPLTVTFNRADERDEISDDGMFQYLTQPACVDSSTLFCELKGRKIPDEVNVSKKEDLELGSFPESNDLISLVQKRHLELEEDRKVPLQAQGKDTIPVAANPAIRSPGTRNKREAPPEAGSNTDLQEKMNMTNDFLTQEFSARDALHRFLCKRTAKSERPKTRAESNTSNTTSTSLAKATLQVRKSAELSSDRSRTPFITLLSLPTPKLVPPTRSHPFIISSSFLKNQRLVLRVQKLYPAADFIERNFFLHRELNKGFAVDTKSAMQLKNRMTYEADMIVSPSTGLIWTTLQKIKQCSLPGSSTQMITRERIIRAAPRYESLLVIIYENIYMSSQDDNDPPREATSELTESDCNAMTEFMEFCSALQDDVQPFFVAGGEEKLHHWIVAMMLKHGVSDSMTLKLLPEETSGEIFLRRAGMNAFAAQAVLAELKCSDSSPDSMDFELEAFVKMSREERLQRFERMMGGRKVLQNVSKCLDARW